MEKIGGSKLMQMQARFQQKQLQERELKIASLYEAQQARALDRVRHSPSNGVNGSRTSPPAHQDAKVPVHPGKVRQMFEERRTKAGIDKSYPLQPIHNTDRQAQKKALPNGYTKVTANSRALEKRVTTKTIVKKQQHKIESTVNGSGDLNHNHEPDLNSIKRTLPKSRGELIARIEELDRVDNNYLIENETFPDALAPTPTPRSPEPKEPKRPPRRSPMNRSSPVKERNAQPVAPPRKATSDNAVLRNTKPPRAMQCSVNQLPKKPPAATDAKTPGPAKRKTASPTVAASGGDGLPCTVCGRKFAADRLEKHQDICKRANNKKRKPFDALKHRLAGTEAEPFINKLRKQRAATSSTKVNKTLNSSWRQKHEEFIAAIRAAKQVQAYVSAGGKLSDLPPPPPSENPDYVQCPHCQRRFNQSAAERHIPKCATYQYNKSKPSQSKAKR